MLRVQDLVTRHGKQVVGWEEMGQVEMQAGWLLQEWNLTPAAIANTLAAARHGAGIILSPASKAYIDMKYDATTPLGLTWAGLLSVEDSYRWEPETLIPGLDPAAIAGVEAPLWAETLQTIAEVEFMAFPRLPGIAEIGWSPAAGRSWDEYRVRLAAQAPRWSVMGVNYYRAPELGN